MPFPEKSIQIPDRPALTLVVLAPEHGIGEKTTLPFIEALVRDYGSSARTFKSSLIFSVPDSAAAMNEDARRVMAWEAIDDESDDLKLDTTQVQQLAESLKKARRDLKESIWRTYKNVLLLGKDNKLRQIDLGLIHSSAAESLPALIFERLRQEGDVEKGISPNFLVRNWPPAFKEWSTRVVRDAFFASPLFPRVVSADVVKETISRGVSNGTFAYVGKTADGSCSPFVFNRPLTTGEIEFSEDILLVRRETAFA